MNRTLSLLRDALHAPPSPEGWSQIIHLLQTRPEGDPLRVVLEYTCDHLTPLARQWRTVANWMPGPWSHPLSDGTCPDADMLAALDLPSVPYHWIPPGTFLMGSPRDEEGRFEDEAPCEVTLTTGFLVGRTPVTQYQWEAIYRRTHTRGQRPSPSEIVGPRNPVTHISWYEAVAFCNTLSELDELPPCYLAPGGAPYGWEQAHARVEPTFAGLDCTGWRLPTEAEWEYACRAGTPDARYGELDDVAWHHGNSRSRSHPVAEKRSNLWGLYDTLGNVWEWCQDAHAPRGTEAATDPLATGPEGHPRVARGAGYDDVARSVRAAWRGVSAPGYRGEYLGMRLARTCP